MRKKKLGFTLAETATAMGIVGIISAIVVPMLVNNVEMRKSGAVLGRLVEQVALGNQNIIQFANARRSDGCFSESLSTVTEKDIGISMAETSILKNSFKTVVPAYWGLKKVLVDSSTILDVKQFSSSNNDGTVNSAVKAGPCYEFAKQTAAVCISGNAGLSADTMAKTGYVLYFDVNGLSTKPNMVGKDMFAFDLLNNGQLEPSSTGNIGAYTKAVVEDGYRNLGRKKN